MAEIAKKKRSKIIRPLLAHFLVYDLIKVSLKLY